MQFSKIIVSAFAAFAAAAPTVSQSESSLVEKRSLLGNDILGGLNGLNFGVQDFAYLSSINGQGFDFLDQQLFLLQQRGFDSVGRFGGLFAAQDFNFDFAIQLAQLQMLTHLAGLGLFNGVSVAGVNLVPQFQLGALGGLGGLNFNQFLDQQVITQVQTIAVSSGLFGGGFGGGFGGIFKE